MPTNSSGSAAPNLAIGYASGFVMALSAATTFVAARAGILGGLSADDLIFARYVVAGLLLLPVLLYWGLRDLAGIGWARGIALLLTGGPPFALLQTGGYAFAPLAHGAIIAPSTVTILSTIAAAWFLGERLTRAHIVGAAIVLAGIGLIGWHGLAGHATGAATFLGDLMFFVSSVLWAAFTVLIRYWRLDALRVTAVVAVLSLAVFVPIYLGYRGLPHVAALPPGAIAFQGFVQGIVQAIFAVGAYSLAIVYLGVSRAVLFPAIVPAVTVLIGIPAVGEIPGATQIAGLVLVSIGLFVAIGLFGRFTRRVD